MRSLQTEGLGLCLHEVIVEVGEGLPGWTHRDLGEGQLLYGQRLDGGPDGAL